MRHLASAAALAALLLLQTPFALAGDAEDAKAIVAELAAAAKAKDSAGAGNAVGKAKTLYASTEDKALRGKLLGEVGKVLKNKKLGDAQLAALGALVEMGAVADAKGAWKHVSKAMPDAKKTEAPTDLQLAAVAAAGRLAQARAIKPLLELGAKAKDNALAAAAVTALGGYGNDKKNRVMVLDELVELGKRTRPGQSTTKTVSPEAQKRWQDVGSAIITALNELTGRKEKDFESWEAIHKEAGKKLGNLFTE